MWKEKVLEELILLGNILELLLFFFFFGITDVMSTVEKYFCKGTLLFYLCRFHRTDHYICRIIRDLRDYCEKIAE